MNPAPVESGTAVPLPVMADRLRVVSDFLTLTKPRVNLLVLATTLVGFYLGTYGPVDVGLLVHTVIGTALVASGAAAFNQVLERDIDGRMRRTRSRPLPAGRLGIPEARWFALVLSVAGLVELLVGANALAAGVAFVTILSYALVYTPLKTRTSLAAVVGAVPGALPPMIGWAAATHTLSVEAWVLFSIVFFWQMPHVLAISWMYREDYERGGIRVLPVEEPDGGSTARQTVTYAAALVPVSLLPTVVGLAGGFYFVAAALAGGLQLWLAIRFARDRSRERARQFFFATIMYLPVLWGLLVLNRV